mgnify:CR=1 FL=1
MYWNSGNPCIRFSSSGLIETWDVLKCFYFFAIHAHHLWINRNMRCIEMLRILCKSLPAPRLIETWDVLKSDEEIARMDTIYRLIETWDVLKYPPYNLQSQQFRINRNMRCIEIGHYDIRNLCGHRLIETWDVLKSSCIGGNGRERD